MARPKNVQIRRGDGSVLHCELIHAGTNEDGLDQWDIAGAEFHPERGDKIYAEEIPGGYHGRRGGRHPAVLVTDPSHDRSIT